MSPGNRSSTTPSGTLRSGGQRWGAPVPIEPGTYLIPRSAWSVADVSVTFPEGWTVQYGHVYAKHGDQDDESGSVRSWSTIHAVHPSHKGGWHERLNHYLFVFHDEMFEALAKSVSVRAVRSTMAECLAGAAQALVEE